MLPWLRSGGAGDHAGDVALRNRQTKEIMQYVAEAGMVGFSERLQIDDVRAMPVPTTAGNHIGWQRRCDARPAATAPAQSARFNRNLLELF